ncbi:hypothetical protein OQ968_14725 [Mycobacterium sp. 663a-19]|uniref:hypothetical protein n=1 Tax=Mycobacterium sp. 663a-19 TaxID=2986148 RepID=UPI002D1F60CB|nr:hypothetical protein [Mycobacterium sp. 663a-19]MEB3982515.1 hypothetical protein [Mycobacterium sp. 663a-19]
MSANIVSYWDFDNQRDAPLTCPSCGWIGSAEDHMDMHNDLLDVSCPKCGCMILIILFPTLAETQAAAAAGNQRAVAQLPGIEAQAEWRRRASNSMLRDAAELPDLDGDRLLILWDLETVDDENWTILRHGEREIWREIAYWEGIERFAEVVELLRARYGSRLVEVCPTPASEAYLWGDRHGVDKMIESINASLCDND